MTGHIPSRTRTPPINYANSGRNIKIINLQPQIRRRHNADSRERS
jgi:hypothetical protein